jgi:PqqD family protein of HPr-rel-A system
MQALLATTQIIPTPHATSCEVAGETVILDAASGQYFALNRIGSAIWQHLQKPCTVLSLCERLRNEYNVTAERCEADVSALLEQLAERGLVRLVS